jgi:hypothetical protein
MTVLKILVAALAFYGAGPFFWNLSEGRLWGPDIVQPIAYFFAALFGIIHLLRLRRNSQIPQRERSLYLAASLALVGAPPVLFFYAGKTPLIGLLWALVDWGVAAALLLGLVLALRGAGLGRAEKAAVIASLLAAILAPFMPWWQRPFDAGILPGALYFPLWKYGVWIVAAIWCLSGWLMLRAGSSKRASGPVNLAQQWEQLRTTLTIGMLIGLAILMGGMYNPVQYSETVYLQTTYFAGTRTGSEIMSIPDLNFVLLLGMGLVVFSLLLMLFPPPQVRRP